VAQVPTLPDSARPLIESGSLAHLVTLNEDGSPQVTCVWVGLDGDEIVCGHVPHLRKLENIKRDSRVALSMEAEESTEIGLKHHLVVYGTARVTEGGAPDLLQELAHTYLGPNVDFPPMPNPPPGYITHISVERVAGVGPWVAS
jgi:PPOX class probable F420-dependent enzyme